MDTSSNSSTHLPSPSPSPRTMRGHKSSSSASHSLHSHPSFFNINSNAFNGNNTTNHNPSSSASSSLLHPMSSHVNNDFRQHSIPIPHSNDDLDRLRLEHQLGHLSIMSSSRASSAPSMSLDDGSSVEIGRAWDGRNLSTQGLTSTGISYSTNPGASPVSTTGHHASAVTLRAGLMGQPSSRERRARDGSDEFDEDRDLKGILGGDGTGLSFGLTDMGLGETPVPASKHAGGGRRVTESDFRSSKSKKNASADQSLDPQQHYNQQHQAPLPLPNNLSRTKLADALTRSFSPRRPSTNSPPPSRNVSAASRSRNARGSTQESHFETLARNIEDQLRAPPSSQQSRTPLNDSNLNPSNNNPPAPSKSPNTSAKVGSGKRQPSGNKKKSDDSRSMRRDAHSMSMLGGLDASAMSLGVSRDTQGRMKLYLPDVTGLSDGVQTPARKGRKGLGDGGFEANEKSYPVESLDALSSRLSKLEQQNALSRRRITELELELQTTGERERAAKDEWRLERELLMRERDRETNLRLTVEKREAAGRGVQGEWERRYWEVVEEKKALEALVASLRLEVSRLTSELNAQAQLIAQLQAQRVADTAEIERRGQEVDRLREEVGRLAQEVGGLRRAVEDRSFAVATATSSAERRPTGVSVDVQTSPIQAPAVVQQEMGEPRMMGLGFGAGLGEHQELSAVEEENDEEDGDSTIGAPTPLVRHAEVRPECRQKVNVEEAQRHQERPSSRLSDGLRAAASVNGSPQLPCSSPRLASSNSLRLPTTTSSILSPRPPHQEALASSIPSFPNVSVADVSAHSSTPGSPSSSASRRHHQQHNRTSSQSHGLQQHQETSFPSIRGEELEKLFFSPPQMHASRLLTSSAIHPPPSSRPTSSSRRAPTAADDAAERSGWARSFDRESNPEEMRKHSSRKEERVQVEKEVHDSLITFDDEVAPAAPAPISRPRLDDPSRPTKTNTNLSDRLPPQTVLTRVLRELEDDFGHYKAIYVELADQYKVMDSAFNPAKRNVLAAHLKEVIDTLEQKGDQIASLYSLLTFGDQPIPSTSSANMTLQEKRAFKSVKDLLRCVEKHNVLPSPPAATSSAKRSSSSSKRREGVV